MLSVQLRFSRRLNSTPVRFSRFLVRVHTDGSFYKYKPNYFYYTLRYTSHFLTVILATFFLKEREHILLKIIASVLTTAGVLLVTK